MVRHDDLPEKVNEEFDRIVRDPDEFQRWVGLVLGRCVTPTLLQDAGEVIPAALFTFIVNVLDVEDEDIVALDKMLDGAMTELREQGLMMGALRKRDGYGYDVRSFWDFATQRAVEESAQMSAEGPEHPATGVTA